MSRRLIDADALMEQVKYIHQAVDTSEINIAHHTGFHSATSQIQGLIAYMPSIDAVKVVRCKDCVAFEQTFDNGSYCGGYCYHWDYEQGESPNSVDGDDYCSYGERKTDG